jgi:exodeoxyribonuclease-5/deoxyribonuclease V
MILAFDTYYQADRAKTVCLAFKDWAAAEATRTEEEIRSGIAPYEPGSFYKRELPCILSLLRTIPLQEVSAIVIDGYVVLDDAGQPGLGARLHASIGGAVPVIGVAKTSYATLSENKRAVYRGESRNPLYITAAGMDLDIAAACIQSMSGPNRIPALLKQLDALTRIM